MKLIVDNRKPRRAAGVAFGWAVLGLVLAFGFRGVAQEPDASSQTNDAAAAEVLARLNELAQAAGLAQPEDMNDLNATNDVSQTGAAPTSGDRPNRFIRPDSGDRSQGSSRSQSSDRRSRGRRSSRSDQAGSYGSSRSYGSGGDRSQTNSASGTNTNLDYAAFQLIVDRNIFDPNRFPHGLGAVVVRPVPRSIDSFTLVGTMSYEKGTFAFFDGTSSDYRKALKLTDSIAGYRVANITPTSVKLASGTNELQLNVGTQLRREEDGPWQLSSQAMSYATTSTSSPTTATTGATSTSSDSAPGGTDSEILKRLMQKREKE